MIKNYYKNDYYDNVITIGLTFVSYNKFLYNIILYDCYDNNSRETKLIVYYLIKLNNLR